MPLVRIDLLKGRMTAITRSTRGPARLEEYQAEQIDPVKDELSDFIHAIEQKRAPRVQGEHGLRALLLANLITESIHRNLAERKAAEIF